MDLEQTIRQRGGNILQMVQYDPKRQTLTLRFGSLFVMFDSVNEFDEEPVTGAKGAETLQNMESYTDLMKTWYIVHTSRREFSFHTHRSPRFKKGKGG